MKWVLITVAALITLVSGATIIGAQMRKDHDARVTVSVPQSPEWVWATITDFAATPQWFTGVKSSERIADINDHPVWREDFDGFTADMETSEWNPPHRLVRVVHATSPGFRGSWTWELQPEGTGTKLTIIERGEIDNPLFRFMARMMDPTATARDYGASLSRRLAAQQQP